MRTNVKAYEIHIFQGGKWKIDSVFDDRDLAMLEAHRMDESGRHPGVRVIEEEFDEGTQKAKVRTIFRGSKIAEFNAQAVAHRREAHQRAEQKRARLAQAHEQKRVAAARAKRQRESSPFRLGLLFSLIALVGLAAVIALRVLFAKI